MSFVLQGEVNIDGRKGVIALKSIQREATKTSQSFDRAGGSTSKLVASFLKANSAASVFGTSLRALGRFGAAGIFGAAAATSINRFGEAVKRTASDYAQTQKSLNSAFETAFKSKNAEEAQGALERTQEIADQLRGKLTQMGPLSNLLGGLEKLTGLKIFGVEDTQKSLEQARQNIKEIEKIIELRKQEKTQIEEIEEATRVRINERRVTGETRKLIDGIRKTQKAIIPTLEDEVQTALDLRGENERILDILKSQNQANRNNEEIKKREIARAGLELNIIKAQNALTLARRADLGRTLGGSKSGQQALQVAERQKRRVQTKQEFQEEQTAVKERQSKENALRAQQGLPALNQADVRKRMASEAIGGGVAESAKGVAQTAMSFTQGSLLPGQAAAKAATKLREEAAPTDFRQRVEQFKSREAQKVMQQEASEKKKGYQKTKIRGQMTSAGGASGGLEAAIRELSGKIPSAVPV